MMIYKISDWQVIYKREYYYFFIFARGKNTELEVSKEIKKKKSLYYCTMVVCWYPT